MGRSKAPAVPGHNDAIRYFTDRWGELYGVKYPFAGGKDAAHVRWMLDAAGSLGVWRLCVDAYLASSDRLAVERAHDLGIMRCQFARWLVAARRARPDFGGDGHVLTLPQIERALPRLYEEK